MTLSNLCQPSVLQCPHSQVKDRAAVSWGVVYEVPIVALADRTGEGPLCLYVTTRHPSADVWVTRDCLQEDWDHVRQFGSHLLMAGLKP